MISFYEQVYAVVRRIPRGRVISYGRIARMLGRPRAARAVGYALNALKDSETGGDVPWQRVVNAAGRISIVNREKSAHEQAALLREEGVAVRDDLTLDLETYLWEGLSLIEIDDILSGASLDRPDLPL